MTDFDLETVAIADLRPHPRNYRSHPDDQIEHLVESIRQNGLYHNIVVARDNTILAGHGVVQAAGKMGFESLPVIRLNLEPDDSRALKVLAGDNEITHLAEIDDRELSKILKEVNEFDGLLGTGYDERMLANLVFVTRPQSEIADFDAAAEWVGMPEYDSSEEPIQLIVNFRNVDDRAAFLEGVDLKTMSRGGRALTAWWPPKE